MTTSQQWIYDFILTDVLASKSIPKDLLVKALGEFTIFCFLIKRTEPLPEAFITILKKIEALDILFDYHCLFLKSCIGDNSFVVTDKSHEGLEIYYIKNVFYNTQHNWNDMLVRFLNQISRQGITLPNTYYLTHILFYSTDFGYKNYWDRQPTVKAVATDVLQLCEAKFRAEENWDILREVYMCQIYLTPESVTKIAENIKSEDMLIKSKHGWYLSDGLNLSCFEKYYNKLTANMKYSLYHTTVISLLLESQLKHYSNLYGYKRKYNKAVTTL